MVKVLGFPIQRSWVGNSWVAPKSTQPFFFLRSTKWAPGSPRDWALKSKSWTLSIKRGCKVVFFKVKVLNWTWLTDPVMYGYKKKLVWPPARQTKGCVTNFYAQIWVMGFCVLYYQTIIFMGVYQRWTMYALKPKSVSEMHFCAKHWLSKKIKLAFEIKPSCQWNPIFKKNKRKTKWHLFKHVSKY